MGPCFVLGGKSRCLSSICDAKACTDFQRAQALHGFVHGLPRRRVPPAHADSAAGTVPLPPLTRGAIAAMTASEPRGRKYGQGYTAAPILSRQRVTHWAVS